MSYSAVKSMVYLQSRHNLQPQSLTAVTSDVVGVDGLGAIRALGKARRKGARRNSQSTEKERLNHAPPCHSKIDYATINLPCAGWGAVLAPTGELGKCVHAGIYIMVLHRRREAAAYGRGSQQGFAGHRTPQSQ